MRIVGTNLPEDAWINAVAAATTANISFAAGQQTIDGVVVGQYSSGDPRVQRVLVWNQTDATTNGVYDATADIPWVRSKDANDKTQWAQGVLIFVNNGGTKYGGALFQMTATGTNGQIILGKTQLTFAQLQLSSFGGQITETQLPTVTIRKPASSATIAINATDIEVGIDTRTTAVTANLPSIASWVAANPFALTLTLVDYFGNAGTNAITPSPNGGDAFQWGGVTPLVEANFAILRLRPDAAASKWMVYQAS